MLMETILIIKLMISYAIFRLYVLLYCTHLGHGKASFLACKPILKY